jgi:multiple sugar transport system substrate-binding protein
MQAVHSRRVALAAFALALSGSAVAQAQSTVTMWTFLDPTRDGGREVALRTMIESFEAANPDIRIRVEPQVWTTLAEKFVLGANVGNAPDIAWVNAENLGLVLNSDAAADLNPLITAGWSEERKSDLLMPRQLDSVTVDGELLAMPLMAITWVMMYRKDLFAEAGLDASSIATWDGVTEAAKALTLDRDGDGVPDVWGIGLGLAQERFSATPAVHAAYQAGGGFFSEDCKVAIAGEGAERAVMLQVDWIQTHEVTPQEALAMTSDDAIDQFSAGRYAMQLIANSRFEQIQRNASGWDKDDLGMAPIPGWNEGELGPQFVTGWFAVAWNRSPQLDAAAKFIDHMASQDGMALWNLPGGQVPMLRSVAERPEMAEAANAHLPEVAGFMAAGGEYMPGACNWARTLADFNLATQRVVLGQAGVSEAVAEIEGATQARQ